MRSTVLVMAVLALTVGGQLLMKARALVHAESPRNSDWLGYFTGMMTDPYVLGSFAAAVLAAMCWILALETLDLGFAYPLLALNFVLVPIGALVLFREPLPPLQLLGLGLIIVGVAVSAFSK